MRSSEVYNIIMLMLAFIGDEGNINDDTGNVEVTDHSFQMVRWVEQMEKMEEMMRSI